MGSYTKKFYTLGTLREYQTVCFDDSGIPDFLFEIEPEKDGNRMFKFHKVYSLEMPSTIVESDLYLFGTVNEFGAVLMQFEESEMKFSERLDYVLHANLIMFIYVYFTTKQENTPT